jgi:hypothetical protein
MKIKPKAVAGLLALPAAAVAIRGQSSYPDKDALRALQGPDYVSASAQAKLDLLWKATMDARYDVLPRIRFSWLLTAWRLLNLWWISKPFDDDGDIRPPRTKLFHAYGVIAKARFVPVAGHPFTGLWETGAIGLVRPSLAIDDKIFFTTGTGLKFLVDGRPSANSLVNPSMDPQKSHDFFEFESTNLLAVPTKLPFGPFWFAAKRWMGLIAPPREQPVDDFAAVTAGGEIVSHPVSPEQIYLCPPDALHTSPESTEDFRAELESIPPDTVVFEVFGKHKREDEERHHMGAIKTESWFVASAFPDRVLSFHHKKGASSSKQETSAAAK